MSSLSSSNGSLSIDVGIGTTDTIQVNGLGTISGNLTLTAFGSASAGTYTILNTNSGLTLSGSPTFVAVPPPQTFGTRASSISFVNPTTTPGQLKIVVIGGAKFLTWTGLTNANWDLTTTPNWVDDLGADKFFNGDIAIFQDNEPNRNINLVGTLTPGLVQFSNNGSNSYTLGGTGVLAGAMTLQKDGDATLTINTSNTYSGTTTFNNGTVIIAGDNSTTGPIFINNGTIIYSAATHQTGSVNLNGGTLMLPDGATFGTSSINLNGGNFVINRTDASTFSNIIGGGNGEIDLVGTGTVTFSGVNTYNASTKVQAGKLIVTNSNSVGTISPATKWISPPARFWTFPATRRQTTSTSAQKASIFRAPARTATARLLTTVSINRMRSRTSIWMATPPSGRSCDSMCAGLEVVQT